MADEEEGRGVAPAPLLTRCLSCYANLRGCRSWAARPLRHELIKLRLVARLAQTLEESPELLRFLLKAPQGLLAIGIEVRIAARAQRPETAEAAAEALRLLHKVLLPLQFASATHASTPDEIGQDTKPDGPPDHEAQDRGDDPRGLPVIVQGSH